jgi:two-component system chemotaxis sensor kinase CheA
MAKYRRLFLEEAGEHLGEISAAMLELEKDAQSAESIDVIFRMAHSIKSMAASLEYDTVTELAHALEDCMEGVRAAGQLAGPHETDPLFRGLEGLEAMVEVIRETGEPPPQQPDLVAALRAVAAGSDAGEADASAVEVPVLEAPPPPLKKKALSPTLGL